MSTTATCVVESHKHGNLDIVALLYAVSILLALFISSLLSSWRQRNPHAGEPTVLVPRGEAGAQVANTFELLEAILLRLPMSDILSAQNVNKQFKNVVNNSQPLQRAIFLGPALVSPRNGSKPPPELNPLLLPRFGTVLGNVSIRRSNHFWIWKARHGLYKKDEEFIRLCLGKDAILLHLKHGGGTESELTEQSWSRMFLTQPPCDVELGVEDQEGRPPITVLKEPTMREIITESRRRLAKHVEPADLPRIRQQAAALTMYGRKLEEMRAESNSNDDALG